HIGTTRKYWAVQDVGFYSVCVSRQIFRFRITASRRLPKINPLGVHSGPTGTGTPFNRAATPLNRGMETKFLSRLNRGNSLNGLKINRYLSCFGTGKTIVSGRSRLRVFYATLARKVPAGPVGRALLHCLEGTFR